MEASRHCARPGCLGPVTAFLSYDYARGTAWLDPPLGTTDAGHWGLCRDHADRLRVPVGWTCEDRRSLAVLSHAGPTAAPPLRVAGRCFGSAMPVDDDGAAAEGPMAEDPMAEDRADADTPAVAI